LISAPKSRRRWIGSRELHLIAPNQSIRAAKLSSLWPKMCSLRILRGITTQNYRTAYGLSQELRSLPVRWAKRPYGCSLLYGVD
jgi:hypothetical protein